MRQAVVHHPSGTASLILKICSSPKRIILIGVSVTGDGGVQISGGSASAGPLRMVTLKQIVIFSSASSVHDTALRLARICPFSSENAPPPPALPSSKRGPPIHPPCSNAASVHVYSTSPLACADAVGSTSNVSTATSKINFRMREHPREIYLQILIAVPAGGAFIAHCGALFVQRSLLIIPVR